MRVGVLALQGDFAKHLVLLQSLGVERQEVRTTADLALCDALILPGGESTAMIRLIDFIGLRRPLIDFARCKPLFGTCAGLILLSQTIEGSSFESLQILDIRVERNAFGRQVESFQAFVPLQLTEGHAQVFPAFFIRAPRIRATGPEVQVLGSLHQEPVLIRQGRHLGASFHPELTADPLIHRYFLAQIQ